MYKILTYNIKMKKILITLTLITLIMSCSYASNYTITINNVDFSIPSEYQGGKMINGNYKLENIFSISCIDENVPSAIGLWATEKDFSEEMVIDGHPVRHYYAYNEYAHEIFHMHILHPANLSTRLNGRTIKSHQILKS